MTEDIIDIKLPAENPEETRDCHMSQELFQNARQTMGEIRDFLRESGVSWDFIRKSIEERQQADSPLNKALQRMDDYSTGPAHSLHDKPSNIQ